MDPDQCLWSELMIFCNLGRLVLVKQTDLDEVLSLVILNNRLKKKHLIEMVHVYWYCNVSTFQVSLLIEVLLLCIYYWIQINKKWSH